MDIALLPCRVEYGLARYYVPEGAALVGGSSTVEIAASKDGHATIKTGLRRPANPYAEAIKGPIIPQ